MRELKRAVWALIFLLSTPALGAPSDCLDSEIEPEVCLKMRHIRSLLLMTEQKLLADGIDYKYLTATSAEMNQMVQQMLREMNTEEHTSALEHLQVTLQTLIRQTEQESIEAYATANKLRISCRECHEEVPTDGEGVNGVFSQEWLESIKSCLANNKNPYICRKMHVVAKNLQYFLTAEKVGAIDFQTAWQSANEIHRVSSGLAQLVAPVHPGGNNQMKELARLSKNAQEMAWERNPDVLDEGPKLFKQCKSCHGGLEDDK